nr:type II toxin-antitoxin system RelB/DinJ family antitoxin [uncultured Oscillibacter sp.]
MAATSSVSVRMDTTLKENAEQILNELGISASGAVQMFYRQIVLRRGLPFELTLPQAKPTAIGGMSREELDMELQKGMASLKAGQRVSAADVDRELAEEFGL